MPLEKELETYDRELPAFLQEHRGEYVLICGETIAGFWPTEDEAYLAGQQRCGPNPFLVMPVVEKQEPVRLLFTPSSHAPNPRHP